MSKIWWELRLYQLCVLGVHKSKVERDKGRKEGRREVGWTRNMPCVEGTERQRLEVTGRRLSFSNPELAVRERVEIGVFLGWQLRGTCGGKPTEGGRWITAESQSVLITTGASKRLGETTSEVGLERLPGEIATEHSLRGAVGHGGSHRRFEVVGGIKILCQEGAESCAGSQIGRAGCEGHGPNSKVIPPFCVVGLWAGDSSALRLSSTIANGGQ